MYFKVALFVLLSVVFSRESFAGSVNVYSIAGKNLHEVNTILQSQPDSCGKSKYGNKCEWENSGIEIVFINEKADWITFGKIESIYNIHALEAIGISGSFPPDANDENIIRWRGIPDLREVSVFPADDGKVDYIYVKTLLE